MIDRNTKVMITVVVVVIVMLIGLAGWGYFTGAWETSPAG
jgi:hypothetical protein